MSDLAALLHADPDLGHGPGCVTRDEAKWPIIADRLRAAGVRVAASRSDAAAPLREALEDALMDCLSLLPPDRVPLLRESTRATCAIATHAPEEAPPGPPRPPKPPKDREWDGS